MAANGSPTPLFETDDDRLSFVIRLPRHPLSLVPTGEVTAQVTGEVTGEVAGEVNPQVTAQVAALLMQMKGEMTRQAMQDAVGLAHREHFRKTYLAPALELGVIEMTLPDKPNSRSQGYRLTASGQQWLEAHADGDPA